MVEAHNNKHARKEVSVKQTNHSKSSPLEAKFLSIWKSVGGPSLEREFMFHPSRKWRADFAHQASRTLIEIEGGAFNGRHTTGKGFIADSEKYLAAYLHRWTVVRLTAPLLTRDNILAVAMRCALSSPPSTESKTGIDHASAEPVVPATAGKTL